MNEPQSAESVAGGDEITCGGTVRQPKLHVTPITLAAANEFVTLHHRHHKKETGHKFSIAVGVSDPDDKLVGVIICGRPKARHLDDGRTLEVTRSCTDGTPNANSALYGAAWRVARELGYDRLITYTQEGESGSSLKGAGWKVIAERPARPGWADSSVKLKHKRDPIGNGGVARLLWEAS